MIVNHRKVAETAISAMHKIVENDCNIYEAREVYRTIRAVINSSQIMPETIEKVVCEELAKRYDDKELNSSTSVF